MALGGVTAFGAVQGVFGATKQAQFLLQQAENMGHDLAARLCELHLSARAALSSDNNFLCMATWMMAGGVSPVAEKILPVTAGECCQLLDKAKERWQKPKPSRILHDRKETLMTINERRLLVRDRAERAARLVRESWDEITALESIVPQDLPFDVHAYVNMLATESDDYRIPEEAIDELLGLSTEDGSKAVNTHEAH